jgi:5-methylthioribose kinase
MSDGSSFIAIDHPQSSTMAAILTQDTVADYVTKNASQINVFPPDASLAATAIQGGNVNFAFCVRSTDGKAVFVKQAPEYVAVFGPDGLPLTSTRIQKEVAILKEWTTILGDEADVYLPKVHYFDDENKVFVMEFLEDFVLLDHHLVASPSPATELSIATQLGEFMARTHLATHSSKITSDRAAFLTIEYENRALRDIQLEYVFTKAYKEESSQLSTEFKVDERFLAEINALKARYNGEVGAGNMSLCHGDLHPGSVMVKIGDATQVRVIDPEFTVFGPPGLDVGSLFSGYILAAVHQSYTTTNEEVKAESVSSITKGVAAAWETYSSVMRKGGVTDEIIREIEVETVGFAVAEVCRTALGHAGMRLWLQFDDKEVHEAAVETALSIVQKCMTTRHDGGIQVLFDCLNSL